FVDAISASAGEYIDVEEFNIDIITGVGGKALGAFPGSAYLCAKGVFYKILKKINVRMCILIFINTIKLLNHLLKHQIHLMLL
ncbi:hypothetical protein BM532_19115, partial [Clostridioides difficile]